MGGGGGPNPPVHQPEPLPAQPAPPVGPGVNNQTADNWFSKFCHWREFANGDHFEQVHGLRISLALSMKTDLCMGWYHGSVIGGSLTRIIGHDTKLNLGGYVGFIAIKKTEITRGSKTARVFAGVKISHVTGKKDKFQGANELQNSLVEKVELANKSSEYWAVRKELETTLKETIKNLTLELGTVETTIPKCEREYAKSEIDAGTAKLDASLLEMKAGNVEWQCSNVKQKASSSLKIVADSATELLASAKWEGYCRGDVKLMASGLQKFAAPITKLG